MKLGKLPEQVKARSVLKQIGRRRKEVLLGPGVGTDCAALSFEGEEACFLTAEPITITGWGLGGRGIHGAANGLAAAGAEPVAVLITALLPESVEEPEIKAMYGEVERVCRELNMEWIGGHTEITSAVTRPVLTVTAIGKSGRKRLLLPGKMAPGEDLVLTKWIALEGTAILAKERETELGKRFAPSFLHIAQEFDQYLSVLPESRIAMACPVSAMYDVAEGGIFGALWEIAEASGVGVEVELKEIPVRQETIEICEHFGVNPYQLRSSGALLAAVKDGEYLVRALREEGIPARVIGKVTKGPGRLLRNRGEVRYLTKGQQDEIYKVLG